jgi:DNA-binding NarL/FixJ family response regulator
VPFARDVGSRHPVRVVIASDSAIIGAGLANVLAADRRFSVCGSTGTDKAASPWIRWLRPEVLLLNATAPAAYARAMRIDVPDVPIVVIAPVHTDEEVFLCALAGTQAYLVPEVSATELRATIHGIAMGEMPCCPRIAAALLRRVESLRTSSGSVADAALTQREREVVRLLVNGLSNKEIARRLCLQLPTVKTHVHHVLGKLGLSSRGQIAAWASDPGVTGPD